MTDDDPISNGEAFVDEARVWKHEFAAPRHVGWLDREVATHTISNAIQWRARTAEGSSLGVFSTRAAAVRAILRAE